MLLRLEQKRRHVTKNSNYLVISRYSHFCFLFPVHDVSCRFILEIWEADLLIEVIIVMS